MIYTQVTLFEIIFNQYEFEKISKEKLIKTFHPEKIECKITQIMVQKKVNSDNDLKLYFLW